MSGDIRPIRRPGERSPDEESAGEERAGQESAADESAALEACRRGDIEGLGLLYELYSERVFRTCLRMVGERAAAADLTQDVFVRVYERLDRFEGRSAFSTWLYRVTVNLCLNRVEALARRRRRAASLEDVEDLADPAAGPEISRRRSEARERLQELLDALRPDHRAILVLREIEELSYAEIVDVLGIAKGTVMSRLHRARRELRRLVPRGNTEAASAVETGEARRAP